jgi:nicotinate-nucleotide adenylyltransferase
MCRLAFEGVEGVIVSDIEIKREGKCYTVETLRELSVDDCRLFMICGTDMILTIDEWDSPEEIFKLCYPVYIRRENDRSLDRTIINKIAEYKERFRKNIVRIDAPAIEISSSEVREKLRRGEDVSRMLPPAVLGYIKEKGLYLK